MMFFFESVFREFFLVNMNLRKELVLLFGDWLRFEDLF